MVFFMQPLLITLALALGLWFDQTVDFWGQTLTNIGIWAFFLYLLKTSNRSQQLGLVLCLLYATAGELFLSLVWGLYEYRLHNVPLFVPPGHVLLFTLGLYLAQKLPTWIIWVVPLIFSPYVLFTILHNLDTFGGLLFLTFVLCIIFGQDKQLYATMFMISLILEIYGTGLGNWTWSTQVPWTALTSTNPPACAGAFYCLLDLLVGATVRRISFGTVATQRKTQLCSATN